MKAQSKQNLVVLIASVAVVGGGLFFMFRSQWPDAKPDPSENRDGDDGPVRLEEQGELSDAQRVISDFLTAMFAADEEGVSRVTCEPLDPDTKERVGQQEMTLAASLDRFALNAPSTFPGFENRKFVAQMGEGEFHFSLISWGDPHFPRFRTFFARRVNDEWKIPFPGDSGYRDPMPDVSDLWSADAFEGVLEKARKWASSVQAQYYRDTFASLQSDLKKRTEARSAGSKKSPSEVVAAFRTQRTEDDPMETLSFFAVPEKPAEGVRDSVVIRFARLLGTMVSDSKTPLTAPEAEHQIGKFAIVALEKPKNLAYTASIVLTEADGHWKILWDRQGSRNRTVFEQFHGVSDARRKQIDELLRWASQRSSAISKKSNEDRQAAQKKSFEDARALAEKRAQSGSPLTTPTATVKAYVAALDEDRRVEVLSYHILQERDQMYGAGFKMANLGTVGYEGVFDDTITSKALDAECVEEHIKGEFASVIVRSGAATSEFVPVRLARVKGEWRLIGGRMGMSSRTIANTLNTLSGGQSYNAEDHKEVMKWGGDARQRLAKEWRQSVYTESIERERKRIGESKVASTPSKAFEMMSKAFVEYDLPTALSLMYVAEPRRDSFGDGLDGSIKFALRMLNVHFRRRIKAPGIGQDKVQKVKENGEVAMMRIQKGDAKKRGRGDAMQHMFGLPHYDLGLIKQGTEWKFVGWINASQFAGYDTVISDTVPEETSRKFLQLEKDWR